MSSAEPTRSDKIWLLAGSIPFLLSVALFGLALNTGFLFAFAVAWPAIQVFGYWGALRLSKGEVDHPLVKAQVMLHYLMLALLVALLVRAS